MRLILILLSMFVFGCTKQYTPTEIPSIVVTLTATPYTTTVNGSTGLYWNFNMKIDKPILQVGKIIFSISSLG